MKNPLLSAFFLSSVGFAAHAAQPAAHAVLPVQKIAIQESGFLAGYTSPFGLMVNGASLVIKSDGQVATVMARSTSYTKDDGDALVIVKISSSKGEMLDSQQVLIVPGDPVSLTMPRNNKGTSPHVVFHLTAE